MPVGKWLYLMHGKTRPGDRAMEFFEANGIDPSAITAAQYVEYDHDRREVTVNEFVKNNNGQKIILNETQWHDNGSVAQSKNTYSADHAPEEFGFVGVLPRTLQEQQDRRRGSGESIREFLISQGWTPPSGE